MKRLDRLTRDLNYCEEGLASFAREPGQFHKETSELFRNKAQLLREIVEQEELEQRLDAIEQSIKAPAR